jgi:hypothetical protein
MSSYQTLIARKSVAPLAWLEIILSVPLITCLYSFRNKQNMWIPTLLLVGLMLGLWIWHRAFHLEVKQETLSYRSLFTGQTELPLADIKSARIEIGCFRFRDRFRPTVRLVIIPKSISAVRPFDISLRVFDRHTIQPLLELLPVEEPA